MKKTDIQAKAKKYFDLNPSVKEVHTTSDGYLFTQKQLAISHATTLEDKEVAKISNGGSTKEVEAEKAEAAKVEAAKKKAAADKIEAEKKEAAKKVEEAAKVEAAKVEAAKKKAAADKIEADKKEAAAKNTAGEKKNTANTGSDQKTKK